MNRRGVRRTKGHCEHHQLRFRRFSTHEEHQPPNLHLARNHSDESLEARGGAGKDAVNDILDRVAGGGGDEDGSDNEESGSVHFWVRVGS